MTKAGDDNTKSGKQQQQKGGKQQQQGNPVEDTTSQTTGAEKEDAKGTFDKVKADARRLEKRSLIPILL